MFKFRRSVLVLLFGALERAKLDGPRDVCDVDAVPDRGFAGRRVGILHERQVPRAELLHEELQPIRILLKMQAAESIKFICDEYSQINMA